MVTKLNNITFGECVWNYVDFHYFCNSLWVNEFFISVLCKYCIWFQQGIFMPILLLQHHLQIIVLNS